jgi:large subunit ribosomal protein L25
VFYGIRNGLALLKETSKLRLDTVVAAEPRSSRGKNEARRLRVTGQIPAVVYGAFKDPVSVTVNPKDILRIIRSKTGHNSIFDVAISGGEKTPVIVADEQYDPIKGHLLHIDLRRIDLTRKLRVSVPVHTTGEPKGVKQQGGVLDVVTRAIEIECIPDDIPNEFVVDVTDLAIGNAIRVSELPVKEGVRVLTTAEAVIAHVVGIKEEVAATPAEGEAAPAEPEVVKKGKKEEEGAAPAAADKGKKK